jgi:hypothetical protein
MPSSPRGSGSRDRPAAGETLVVSAASGQSAAVGQLAKVEAAARRHAGGKAKCDYVVQELGFDACVDYKAGNLARELRNACLKGVDVNFENVGGAILDAVLALMNPFSRVVVCGLIAEYDAAEPYRYQRLRSVLVNRIRMQGMIVFDWNDRYGEAVAGLSARFAEGKLKYRESIVEGLDNAPRGFIRAPQGRELRQAAGAARLDLGQSGGPWPGPPRQRILEQTRRAHTAADAHRHDGELRSAAPAFDQRVRSETRRPTRRSGWPTAIRATVDVEAIVRKAQLVAAVDDQHRASARSAPQVDVLRCVLPGPE